MHHETIATTTPAARPIAIEVDGEPLGVAVPVDTGVRFLAVRLSAFSLDGQLFESAEAARLAITEAIRIAPPATP